MKTVSISSNKKVLTDYFSEPLCEVRSAIVFIDTASGNLTINKLAESEPVLVAGSLEYIANQRMPTRSVKMRNDEATLTLISKSIGRPLFRLPWSGCIAATDWNIHLNPDVRAEITARSGGGNVKLDLASMTVTRVSAESGGGNLDLILPDHAANLNVSAKTGGGNVTVVIGSGMTGINIVDAGSGAGKVVVRIPGGIAARIHATTGWGKATVDPQFSQIDETTYQSPDFDRAANKAEITVKSGAGDVLVQTR
jgi:hypothetical protein